MLSVEVGEPALYQDLSMFPLASPCAIDTPDYLLLDEALTGQTLAITELSEQGVVPELALTNNADEAILLLDGEELIGAMRDIFEDHASQIEKYVRGFRSQASQCGAIFAIAGEVVGMDIFDCPDTFSKVLPKLIRSYALDAVEVKTAETEPPRREDMDKFVEQVMSAKQITAQAIGVGTDIRLDSQEVAGGALAACDRIVHLCTFRVSNGSGRTRSTRIARASRRFRR